MNRAARRLPLFECDEDYAGFLRVLREAQSRIPIRLLSYSLMPNHWHMVVWPGADEELSCFMAWVTTTHARRWNRPRDHHFLVVCRYVERNPVTARLVSRAADWRWSSAASTPGPLHPGLEPWPVARPEPWSEYVDRYESVGEFDRLRAAIRSGRPFGPDRWRMKTARRLKWHVTERPPGRPKRR